MTDRVVPGQLIVDLPELEICLRGQLGGAGAAAVDRGCGLPNLGGGYTGSGPDLGCHDLDAALPHYGPRGSQTE